MLTDDDLTRQLGAAFRSGTEDLAYTGRVPTPRSGATLGVPLVTTAATVAALAGAWASGPEPDAPPTPPSAGPSPRPSTVEPPLETDTVKIAGFTFTVRHPPGITIAEMLRARVLDIDEVPDTARPVEVAPPARAWVGTDPRTGDAALYLRSPNQFDGRLFEIASPEITEAEFERAVLSHRP